jgi:predicted  nucleic acid-binding Zn-ribbon protein
LALPTEAPERVRQLRAQLAALEEEAPKSGSDQTTAAPATEVLRFSAAVRKDFLDAQVATTEYRIKQHAHLTALASAKRDLSKARVTKLAARLGASQALLKELQTRAVANLQRATEEDRRASSALPAPVQRLAETNAALSLELTSVADKIESVEGRKGDLEARVEQMRKAIAGLRQRVDVVGPTEAVAQTLLKSRIQLPSPRSYRKVAGAHRAEISGAMLRQLDLDDLRQWGHAAPT